MQNLKVLGIMNLLSVKIDFTRYHLRLLNSFLQSWHLIGTVGVLLSYPFLFAPAIGINRDVVQCTANTECDDNKMMTIYYSVFSAIHNISWAFVQISHLAMIPEITSNERQRGFLTTMRNIGAVMSNIFVYSILWIMLGTGKMFIFLNE